MYCKYCGKPLSDGARFCGFCGKDQSERCINNMLRVVSYSTNISKQFICAISSFIINCAIILLCLTDLFNLKVNIGDLYSDSTHFGVLDLFENTDMLNAFSYISTDVQQVSELLFLWGLAICVVALMYVIYILDFAYSCWENAKSSTSFLICKSYKTFSWIPFCFLFAVLIIGMWISFSSLKSIGSVTPTVSSIIIYILGAIQFVINRFLHLK